MERRKRRRKDTREEVREKLRNRGTEEPRNVVYTI